MWTTGFDLNKPLQFPFFLLPLPLLQGYKKQSLPNHFLHRINRHPLRTISTFHFLWIKRDRLFRKAPELYKLLVQKGAHKNSPQVLLLRSYG